MSQPSEWPGDLRVERITPPSLLTCAASLGSAEVMCEVTPCHPLLVRDRGWVTLCPDSFHKRYGLKCYPIQPGDIIVQPSSPLPLTSPDICDRIKRLVMLAKRAKMIEVVFCTFFTITLQVLVHRKMCTLITDQMLAITDLVSPLWMTRHLLQRFCSLLRQLQQEKPRTRQTNPSDQ